MKETKTKSWHQIQLQQVLDVLVTLLSSRSFGSPTSSLLPFPLSPSSPTPSHRPPPDDPPPLVGTYERNQPQIEPLKPGIRDRQERGKRRKWNLSIEFESGPSRADEDEKNDEIDWIGVLRRPSQVRCPRADGPSQILGRRHHHRCPRSSLVHPPPC